LALVFLVTEGPKFKIQFNGCEYASVDEMPASVKAAYDAAIHETPELHSGARLAAKLKAKIIVNDTEFSHVGEMSVDDRHLYHEALEAVFPPNIAVSAEEVEVLVSQLASRYKKVLLGLAVVSVLAGTIYLWLHGFFG
jgi:hypothetical protein